MAFSSPDSFPIGATVQYKAARMEIEHGYFGDALIEWSGIVNGECELDHAGRPTSIPLHVKRIGKDVTTFFVPVENILSVID